jgi:malonyl-CoA O-methyltransferase
MPAPAPASASREIDPIALARQSARLRQAPQAPWLHSEVARRMAERLRVIRHPPTAWLDWQGAVGGGAAAVRAVYPDARRIAVEADGTTLARSRAGEGAAWWQRRRWRGDEGWLVDELPPRSAGLLWANMTLHQQPDLPAEMAAWQRALAVDGFLMFSTLGPDTLRELRALYADLGWGPPHAPFVDMHDLGDMLVHAGFADPVMDQERITLHWSTPAAMTAELRGLGGNAAPGRMPGLRTPRWRERLHAALRERAGPDGRLALSFELVYGHAVCVAPRVRMQAETSISVDTMRSALSSRSGRENPN